MANSGKPLIGRFLNANETQLDHGQHDIQWSSLPQIPPITYHGLIPPTPPCDHGKPEKTLVLNAQLNLPQPSHQHGSVVMSPFVRQGIEGTEIRLKSVSLSKIFAYAISNDDNPVSDDQRHETRNDESVLPQLDFSPTTLNATGMPRVRDKIRRQLGQLFVYPLVYLMGWLIPFISHVVESDKTGRPFWLVLASLISLCTQGLADSVVFLIMEKPWRYWTRDDVTAWCCFCWSKQSSMMGSGIKVGRTREEMRIDGTIARRRRERERTEGRLRSAGRGTTSRDWWDPTLVEIDESNIEDAETAIRSGNY
ncbi:hypothetical protein E4U21_006766 [Claviceps maximensis]|nr:hypothetical protein E4U21_006766 [Claviceps maximensis]